jgi:hypothetical protein
MKNDYNGLVEQSEMNQSVDENFNNHDPLPEAEFAIGITHMLLELAIFSLFLHKSIVCRAILLC